MVRDAAEADVPTILCFIRELARYERLEHEVVADEHRLRRTLFGPRPYAECRIAEWDLEPVGFALFFHNYSTFLGRPGIYLEDLYVRERFRGRGVGLALLRDLAGIAVGRDCARLDWSVLDWNEPALGFYRELGARALDDWTVHRLDGDALLRFARGRGPV